MACRLAGAKPLSEAMLEYCWLDPSLSEILLEIYTFSFMKMQLKLSSVKWRPFCLGPNLLKREDPGPLKYALNKRFYQVNA